MENRILIADGSRTDTDLLLELLCDLYDLETASNSEECLQKLPMFGPELVLLDSELPGRGGCETCRQIKQSPVGNFTQVILLGTETSADERLRGYGAGADDYVVKPFDNVELLSRIGVQYRLRDTREELWRANGLIHNFNAELEDLVAQRTAEVVATRDVAVLALANLAESRDPETGEHLERIRTYARILAEQLAAEGPYIDRIDEQFIDNVYRSSPLHDIGKVGIADSILLKPGRLTEDEFTTMRQHSAIGAEAMRKASRQSASGGFLDMAIDIARHHHERFDGNGYPDGLAGTGIPLSARIVTLADVYDALTSVRVYKPAYEPARAKDIIEEESGAHFDPAVVDAFRTRYDEFLRITAARKAADVDVLALSEARR